MVWIIALMISWGGSDTWVFTPVLPNRQNKGNFLISLSLHLFPEDKLAGDCWSLGRESCSQGQRPPEVILSLNLLVPHTQLSSPSAEPDRLPSPGLNTPKPQTDLSSWAVWTMNIPNYKWEKVPHPFLSNKLAIKQSLLAISGRNLLFFVEKIKYISTTRY